MVAQAYTGTEDRTTGATLQRWSPTGAPLSGTVPVFDGPSVATEVTLVRRASDVLVAWIQIGYPGAIEIARLAPP